MRAKKFYHLPNCPSLCLSICPSIYSPIIYHLSVIHLSVLSTHPYPHLSIIYLYLYFHVYLSVYTQKQGEPFRAIRKTPNNNRLIHKSEPEAQREQVM